MGGKERGGANRMLGKGVAGAELVGKGGGAKKKKHNEDRENREKEEESRANDNRLWQMRRHRVHQNGAWPRFFWGSERSKPV